MMEHEFSENVREQIQNMEMSEAEKLKLPRANGLFVAVRDGIVNLVNEKFAKKDSKKSMDKLGESGLTLLHQAAQYGRTDIARSLLDNGAEIDVRTREDNLTPLHIATRWACLLRELEILALYTVCILYVDIFHFLEMVYFVKLC